MKEIGGYMELDENDGKEYHEEAIALNSGRHCLEYLIRAKNIKKLYIPYFLCASIKDLCEKCNCEYEYYNIKDDFSIDFEKELLSNEYLYIVNYYGQISASIQKEYKKKYKNIVVDNSQAFFEMPIENIDTLYTCRKFFGVSDGGYLYTNKLLNSELEIDISYDRIKFVLGRYEIDASTFFKEASQNNKIFKTEKLKQMSKLTHNFLKGINYKKIAEIRNKNFEYLNSNLYSINRLNLTIPYGPFMYPLYINKGKELKKELIEHKIYVPTLWSDVYDVIDNSSLEWNMAENIIPIPCDQRYNIKDMEVIIEIIRKRCEINV